MKIRTLYFHLQLGKPYFIRPESGEQMWQLHLGFMTITRMDEGYQPPTS